MNSTAFDHVYIMIFKSIAFYIVFPVIERNKCTYKHHKHLCVMLNNKSWIFRAEFFIVNTTTKKQYKAKHYIFQVRCCLT